MVEELGKLADAPITRAGRAVRLVMVGVATAWALLTLYSLTSLSLSWPDQLFGTDFVSFWTGASLIRAGAGPALFDMETQRVFQQHLRQELATTETVQNALGHNPFHSPPPLALLFLPLTWLPMPWAYLSWMVLSFVSMALAVFLPLRARPMAWAMAAGLLAFPGVLVTLLEGQVNGVLLLAFSLGLMAFSTGRRVLGGVLFGLMWLKPQYALLFPLIFLLKRRWVELAAMSLVGLAIAILSVAMIGFDGIARYLAVLQRIGAFYPPPESLISAGAMSNWRGLLINLFPGLPGDVGSVLVYGLGGATVAASLLVWKGPWDPSSLRFSIQMVVAAAATVIASPHSHYHGTVLLLVPLAVAIGRAKQGAPFEGRWMVMLAAAYLLGMEAWLARSVSWMLVPYFLVLMAMLIKTCWGSAPMEVGRG